MTARKARSYLSQTDYRLQARFRKGCPRRGSSLLDAVNQLMQSQAISREDSNHPTSLQADGKIDFSKPDELPRDQQYNGNNDVDC